MSESKSFEASLQELEAIVKQLEQGELPLDEALKKFEEGVQLTRGCQKTLNDAELKIKTITQSEDVNTDE